MNILIQTKQNPMVRDYHEEFQFKPPRRKTDFVPERTVPYPLTRRPRARHARAVEPHPAAALHGVGPRDLVAVDGDVAEAGGDAARAVPGGRGVAGPGVDVRGA